MNDEELLAQAAQALIEIKVNQGLSDRHAASGSRGEGLERKLAEAERERKPSLDDLLAKPEPKRDLPS